MVALSKKGWQQPRAKDQLMMVLYSICKPGNCTLLPLSGYQLMSSMIPTSCVTLRLVAILYPLNNVKMISCTTDSGPWESTSFWKQWKPRFPWKVWRRKVSEAASPEWRPSNKTDKVLPVTIFGCRSAKRTDGTRIQEEWMPAIPLGSFVKDQTLSYHMVKCDGILGVLAISYKKKLYANEPGKPRNVHLHLELLQSLIWHIPGNNPSIDDRIRILRRHTMVIILITPLPCFLIWFVAVQNRLCHYHHWTRSFIHEV